MDFFKRSMEFRSVYQWTCRKTMQDSKYSSDDLEMSIMLLRNTVPDITWSFVPFAAIFRSKTQDLQTAAFPKWAKMILATQNFLFFFVIVSFYVKDFHGRRFYTQNPLLYMSAVTISRHARNCGPNYDFQVTSLSSNITYHHIMFRNYHGNPNPPCSHTRKCASEVPMMLTFEHLRTVSESGSLYSPL